MKRDQKRITQQVSLDLVKKIKELYPGLAFGEGLENYIRSLEEKPKAGVEASSPILSESVDHGPPSSPAVGEEAASPATYDWTQVPECPLRYEEGNICFYKKPGRKAIMEHVEPWMCQRCEHTLKINQKVAEIENEVIQQRVRRLDWLDRHQAEKSQQKEEPEKKVEPPEEGQPSQPKFIPRRLADLGGPDGY